jgi:hypothetical protein
LAQKPGSGNVATLINTSPGDVTLSLNAETNSVTASLHLGDGLLQNPEYNLEFGGAGHSAYIDDKIFAAVETPYASRVNETSIALRWPTIQVTTYTPTVAGFVVSADAIGANEVLFPGETVPAQNPDHLNPPPPPVQKRAFCQSCEFLQWGAWGARVDYAKNNQTVTKDVQLGWWITGDVVAKNDMPTTGSATYAGDAIGTVSANGQKYAATGDLGMTWDFGKRSGLLQISDFDGKDFGGIMLAPGRAQFAGALVGAGGLVGAANGSFVGSTGARAIPNGVIGNFGVGNSSWQATGIFGGTAVPR